MLRTLVLGGIAGTLIAWNWFRLEDGKNGGEALLIIVLAVVPALFPRLRERVAAAAVAFLIAAGIAFDQGPGLHYPGRGLRRFCQGFLGFYGLQLPVAGG